MTRVDCVCSQSNNTSLFQHMHVHHVAIRRCAVALFRIYMGILQNPFGHSAMHVFHLTDIDVAV